MCDQNTKTSRRFDNNIRPSERNEYHPAAAQYGKINEKSLNALTIINIKNEIISDDVDFNKNVIDAFNKIKYIRLDFKYKNIEVVVFSKTYLCFCFSILWY